MRRWCWLAGLLCSIGLVGPVASAASAQDTPVPVGAIEVLSGPNAAYGTSIRAGLELALDTINKKGVLGGRAIALSIEDSAASKEQAINAARKLIGRDKVVAIIGPMLSNEMFAVGPVTNGRGIPTIGTSTTAPGITDIGPFIFRTSLPEADVVPVTLGHAHAHGGNTIALMYANDDAFSKAGFAAMRAAADTVGLKTLTAESFGSKDTDFSAQLTKIQELKPDIVAISALVEPICGVLLQARQLGFGPPTQFVAGNGGNSPKVGALAGAAADGLLVGSPWFVAKPDPLNQAFVAAFSAKNGHPPDQFAAQAYDTMFILAEAIDRAGAAEPDKIRIALAATDHTGVMGRFRFTDHRDPAGTDNVVVLVMHDGKFQIAP
jgi:branched-chain amino acid transport system substrate-binding protein